MKNLCFLCAALALLSAPLHAAITVSLKDGSSVAAASLAPQGASKLRITPEGGGTPRVVDVSAIDRVEMDPPQSLTDTYTAFAAGDTVQTLGAMGKLRVELEPLKTIPGGREWWLEGEFLRAHILLSQKRIADVEASMKEIAANSADPEAQRHARVFLAHLTALAGDPRKALEQLQEIILASRDNETLADAWLFAGQSHAALSEQQQAVVAFLRVPVFYPARQVPLAGAQLGAARCFIALEDISSARRVLKDLTTQSPNTPEGQEGKKLLSQLQRDSASAGSDNSPGK